MYFILNRSNHEVVISDLNVGLKAHRAMDLEAVCSREKIDSSKDLKSAIKLGKIQVRHDSRPRAPEQTVQPKQSPYIDEIRQVVSEELKNHLSGESNNDKLVEVIEKLAGVLDQEKLVAPTQQQAQVEPKPDQDPEEDIDEEKLAEIHAKHMRKVSEKTEAGRLSYEETTSADDVAERVARLRNLRGG